MRTTRYSTLSCLLVVAALFVLSASVALANQRRTIGTGNWSDTRVWENSILPQDGDDVVISSGTDVTLDITTPKLGAVDIDGTLHGSTQSLWIATTFTGTGTWLPDSGRVFFYNSSIQTIDGMSFGNYYDLILADTDFAAGARVITRPLTIDRNLIARFNSDTVAISGTGSVSVGGDLIYIGGSAFGWSGTLTFISAHSTAQRDTSFFVARTNAHSPSESFVLPQIVIAKNDSSLVRLGASRFQADTLFVSNTDDTLISVRSGAFDVQWGWLSLTGAAVSARPIVHVLKGARFRVATPLPVYNGATEDAIFDSLHAPLFALDSGSAFEYYSYGSDVIDASYLMNNIVGHAYQNLVIGSNAIASAWSNPLVIRGTLRIERGATIVPRYVKAGAKGLDPQQITIYGDVVNEAPGPSGATGYYGGTVSTGTDRWTFASDRTDDGKDTVHWSGPSQLGTVIIQPNVVLSVRHLSDDVYDSMDVITQLIEEAPPCGGHLIGTVYSEVPAVFTEGHTVDSVHGFGLTLTSGSDPYPGNVRVMRTSGYLPPGADPDSHPILRYYATYADTGAQRLPSTIRAQFHCDELNGRSASALNLWRSLDKRGAWLYLGSPSYDSSGFAMSWQTSELYPIGTKRPYYWMFAEGYRDTPTPVELLSFHAASTVDGVRLDWQTASEIDLLGFEIERVTDSGESTVASWQTAQSLLAKSSSGAKYSFVDRAPSSSVAQYRLYDVSIDGMRSLAATRTLAYQAPRTVLEYNDGRLTLPENWSSGDVLLFDLTGALVYRAQLTGGAALAVELRPGLYAVEARGPEVKRALLLVR